jgi:hypothetical protein
MNLGEREKRSKIYIPNGQSITINDDSYNKLTDDKAEERIYVQQKK